MIDKMDAKIDFREQNTSAGTFASQWVYQKDFIKLKVEEDEAILMKPIETSSYCDVIRSLCVINARFGEEEQSMLLNELMIDLFAGHGFIDRFSGVRKFRSGLWQRREICYQRDTVCSIV